MPEVQKYRKKPIVVEAIRLTEDNAIDVIAFIGDAYKSRVLHPAYARSIVVKTLEGDMRASIGDYIIKGVNGEFYPCQSGVFSKTYEKAGA